MANYRSANPMAPGATTRRALPDQSRVEAIHRVNEGSAYLEAHVNEMRRLYSSPKEAAQAFGKVFAAESGKLGLEFGANIIKAFVPGKIMYRLENFCSTSMIQNLGPGNGYSLGNVTLPGRSVAITYWGWVHTHPTMDGGFSYSDVQVSLIRQKNAYVIFPNRSMMSFDYSKFNGQEVRYVWYHQSEFQF